MEITLIASYGLAGLGLVLAAHPAAEALIEALRG
jgi:hypothetical protein